MVGYFVNTCKNGFIWQLNEKQGVFNRLLICYSWRLFVSYKTVREKTGCEMSFQMKWSVDHLYIFPDKVSKWVVCMLASWKEAGGELSSEKLIFDVIFGGFTWYWGAIEQMERVAGFSSTQNQTLIGPLLPGVLCNMGITLTFVAKSLLSNQMTLR